MAFKADLHYHGPIGFQQHWLKRQGYLGYNPLQLMTDVCIRRGIDVCAITSQADKIEPKSVDDRFHCIHHHEAPNLSKEYSHSLLGKDVLVVEKDSKKVYFVNGQTVMSEEDGHRFDILVFGSNRIPNGLSIDETFRHCSDLPVTVVAEHPFAVRHRGLGKERLEEHIDRFHAIEGFNAQFIIPGFLTHLPIIGNYLLEASRNNNVLATNIAKKYGKPCVSNSDGHRIEDAGISHNIIRGDIKNRSEEDFLIGIREAISSGNFMRYERYQDIFGWLSWVYDFKLGLKDVDEKELLYTDSLSLSKERIKNANNGR